MTTTCPDAQLLADAARVLAARRALEPVLESLADAPFDPCAVNELRFWLDHAYPRAAAALDRLRASDAVAPHRPVRSVLTWGPDLQASLERNGMHR